MKKTVSTQTIHSSTSELNQITGNFPIVNKTYENLKNCLYPDMFGCQNDKNGNKIFENQIY